MYAYVVTLLLRRSDADEVFQETSLVPSMTVAQNLYLGDEKFMNRLRGVYIAAQQFLQSLNFPVDPTAMVASLGAAKRQMVEIARAVHHNSQRHARILTSVKAMMKTLICALMSNDSIRPRVQPLRAAVELRHRSRLCACCSTPTTRGK